MTVSSDALIETEAASDETTASHHELPASEVPSTMRTPAERRFRGARGFFRASLAWCQRSVPSLFRFASSANPREVRSRLEKQVTAVAMVVFAVVLLRHAWLSDDAYITFRCVRNFLQGHGLRWNITERVQAFTHPLWLFLLSLAQIVGQDIYYASLGLSFLCSLILLVTLRAGLSMGSFLLAMVCLLSSKSFVDYSWSGLENPATHVLYGLFLLRALRAPQADVRDEQKAFYFLALLAGLLGTNRLDNLLFCLPVLIGRAFVFRRHPRILARAALGFLPLALWELFAMIYYGFPYPNTAYSKLATGIPAAQLRLQGVMYFVSELFFDPVAIILIVAAIALALGARLKHLYLPLVGVLLYLLYMVRIGGDFMAGRFFSTPVLGATLILVAALSAIVESTPVAVALLAAGAALGLGFLVTPHPTLAPETTACRALPPGESGWDARGVAYERVYYCRYTGLIQVMREGSLPTDDRVARGRALSVDHATALGMLGVSGYFAPESAVIVDAHGLSDAFISHLPVPKTTGWRIGHFARAIPEGYLATLDNEKRKGPVVIQKPTWAELYKHLRPVVAGPIWSFDRFKEIARFNLGSYAQLAR